jgi:toxin ParE1/3/4
MARFTRSEQAEQDLEEILDYLDGQSTQAADRFARKLKEGCQLHAVYRQIGASAEEFAPNLRYFTVWNYAVFYRPITDGIEIIRIIHGARDLPRFFE